MSLIPSTSAFSRPIAIRVSLEALAEAQAMNLPAGQVGLPKSFVPDTSGQIQLILTYIIKSLQW